MIPELLPHGGTNRQFFCIRPGCLNSQTLSFWPLKRVWIHLPKWGVKTDVELETYMFEFEHAICCMWAALPNPYLPGFSCLHSWGIQDLRPEGPTPLAATNLRKWISKNKSSGAWNMIKLVDTLPTLKIKIWFLCHDIALTNESQVTVNYRISFQELVGGVVRRRPWRWMCL